MSTHDLPKLNFEGSFFEQAGIDFFDLGIIMIEQD